MQKDRRPRSGNNYAPPFGEARSFGRNTSPVPLEVASALKVKNFRKLVGVMGEEQLAIWLDVSLQRVKEMFEGINLGDEMAYHIESALGLPSGFMHQVNPMLPPDEELRLKAGLPDLKFEPAAPVLALVPPPLKPTLLLAPQEKPMTETPLPPIAVPVTPPEDLLREIRRQNLLLLTQRPGAKTQLGRLTDLSAANVSHRLHGNKIFDHNTAVFFSEKLGLPAGWFEVPQSEATIPVATLEMLLNKASTALPSQIKPKPASRSRTSVPIVAIPTGLAGTTAASAPVSANPAALSRPAPAQVTAPAVAAIAPAAPQPSPPQELAPAPTPAIYAAAPTPSRLMPTGAVGPVVAALMQTIALKAQAGRITEEQALKMLLDTAAY